MPGKIEWLEVELHQSSALERFSVPFGDCTRSEDCFKSGDDFVALVLRPPLQNYVWYSTSPNSRINSTFNSNYS